MKIFYFIALFLVLGTIITGMLFCTNFSDISLYIDPASFLILLFPALLLIKSQFGWTEIGEAFSLAFSRKPVKKSQLEKALLFFTTLQKYLIWAGIIGFTIGVIAMFSDISDYTVVGRSLAVALLVLFYAFILIFAVVLPFQAGLKKRIAENDE
jgi:flagellar motor component MotA